MIKILLKAVNFIVSFIVFFSLCTAGVYAAYALWDNSRIYAAAKDVQADMLKLKPQTQDVENGASFEELLAVNPNVCAWVSLDNTKVDYPVLQGANNMIYLNQDVYGDFARDEKSRTFSSNSKRSHILRTSSRSRRLILSSIVSFAVWLKWTRTI